MCYTVTETSAKGFLKRSALRALLKIKSQNEMISKNFAWTLFTVLAIAIAFFVYIYISQTNDTVAPTTQTPISSAGEKNLPAPTGNVDDITKDLLNSASSEQEMVSQEDSDKALIDGDIKIINEFGQSYNENEL